MFRRFVVLHFPYTPVLTFVLLGRAFLIGCRALLKSRCTFLSLKSYLPLTLVVPSFHLSRTFLLLESCFPSVAQVVPSFHQVVPSLHHFAPSVFRSSFFPLSLVQFSEEGAE